METPLVSVHLVTYNHYKYIRQCIESVLNQKTDFEVEIVIGDDCSTDGTTQIVEEYAQKFPGKINAVFSPVNTGFLQNWKRIYEKCRGKYIAQLEGDDFWHNPHKLQKQVEFLEANPEYGLVHSDYDRYYEKGNRLLKDYNRNHAFYFPDGDVYEFLMNPYNSRFRSITTLIRKEILDAHFNVNDAIQQQWKTLDLPIGLAVAKYAKYKYINESLATYRILKESISNTFNQQKKLNFHLSIFNIYRFYIIKYNCSNQISDRINKFIYEALLNDALYLGDKKLGKQSYQKLLELKEKKVSNFEKLKYFIISLHPVNLIFLWMYRIKNKLF